MDYTDSIQLIILPYSAVSFSIVARFIFMYLLYTKKSTNIYSLAFCRLSIISLLTIHRLLSAAPLKYCCSVPGLYIIRNRCYQIPISSENRSADAVVI